LIKTSVILTDAANNIFDKSKNINSIELEMLINAQNLAKNAKDHFF